MELALINIYMLFCDLNGHARFIRIKLISKGRMELAIL